MVLFLEQVLIFALVIGRWLAPKNDEQDGDYFRWNFNIIFKHENYFIALFS